MNLKIQQEKTANRLEDQVVCIQNSEGRWMEITN